MTEPPEIDLSLPYISEGLEGIGGMIIVFININ